MIYTIHDFEVCVCHQLCEQVGEDLVSCEGQCYGKFHLHCLGLDVMTKPGDCLGLDVMTKPEDCLALDVMTKPEDCLALDVMTKPEDCLGLDVMTKPEDCLGLDTTTKPEHKVLCKDCSSGEREMGWV